MAASHQELGGQIVRKPVFNLGCFLAVLALCACAPIDPSVILDAGVDAAKDVDLDADLDANSVPQVVIDAGCLPIAVCDGSTCTFGGPQGAPCNANEECESCFCVDGVCCDSECSGTCETCAAAKQKLGLDGVCGFIAASTDPDDECALDCNGWGQCNVLPPNGSPCALGSACASGQCVDGFCCNSACTDSCFACDVPGLEGTCMAEAGLSCSSCGLSLGFPNLPLMYAGLSPIVLAASDWNLDGIEDVAIMNYNGGTAITVRMGLGNGHFGPDTNYVLSLIGGSTNDLQVADVDLDGTPDIVGSSSEAEISVLRNQGDGTFVVTNYPTDSYGRIAVADFDGDGAVDIAQTPGLAINFNDGTGSFDTQVRYSYDPSFGGVRAIGAGDFDGDGAVDIAFSRNGSDLLIQRNLGNRTFAPAVIYPLGTTPGEFAVTDLDNDGFADIASANYGTKSIGIFMNLGDGTLAPEVDYPLRDGSEPNRIKAADFDRDGFQDLMTVTPGLISIFRNRGNGTFGPRKQFATPSDTRVVIPIDLNADGAPDVIASSHWPNVQETMMNIGNGDIASRVQLTEGLTTSTFFLADFDGDLDSDLWVHEPFTHQFDLLLNQGSGKFSMLAAYPVDPPSNEFTVGDLDNDGRADLVFLHSSGNTLGVRLNQGNGGFGPEVQYPMIGTSHLIVASDLNGDGLLDLATILPNNSSVAILWNLGGGVFGNAIQYPANLLADITFLESADIDGDGARDLAFLNDEGGMMSVLWNQANGASWTQTNVLLTTGAAIPWGLTFADFNADGLLDVVTTNGKTLSLRMNVGNRQFGPIVEHQVPGSHATVAADIDGDGDIDLAAGNPLVVLLNDGTGTLTKYGEYAINGYYLQAADMNGDGRIDIVNNADGDLSYWPQTCLP